MRHTVTLAPPRPGGEEPATARPQTVRTSRDTHAVRNPGNTSENCLAIPFIALGTDTRDRGDLAFEPATATAQAHRHRASAALLTAP
jgi:hypothetical protein